MILDYFTAWDAAVSVFAVSEECLLGMTTPITKNMANTIAAANSPIRVIGDFSIRSLLKIFPKTGSFEAFRVAYFAMKVAA
jgi:hypothetical protein